MYHHPRQTHRNICCYIPERYRDLWYDSLPFMFDLSLYTNHNRNPNHNHDQNNLVLSGLRPINTTSTSGKDIFMSPITLKLKVLRRRRRRPALPLYIYIHVSFLTMNTTSPIEAIDQLYNPRKHLEHFVRDAARPLGYRLGDKELTYPHYYIPGARPLSSNLILSTVCEVNKSE